MATNVEERARALLLRYPALALLSPTALRELASEGPEPTECAFCGCPLAEEERSFGACKLCR